MNLNFEGFTFPELYSNLEELGIDPSCDLSDSEGGGVQRIGDELFRFMLPDGKYVYFDTEGTILKIE